MGLATSLRVLAVVVGTGSLSSCLFLDGGSEAQVKGTSADVMTAPGSYDGYRVIYPCSLSAPDLGIRGLGTREITGVDAIWAFGNQAFDAVRDVPSVWRGGGISRGCEPGSGTSIALDDWHDVDEVLARLGRLVREQDVAVQVGISVTTIPVAAQ
jgi:hypothetical protein